MKPKLAGKKKIKENKVGQSQESPHKRTGG